jgi:hypothetical protein
MSYESGIKVWLHAETMTLALSWHVYGCVRAKASGDLDIPPHITIESYQYVGEAMENPNGVTCIFHEDYLKNFEFIGFL